MARLILIFAFVCLAMKAVDNSSLKGVKLATHHKTYGLVYLVPNDAYDKVLQISNGALREKLVLHKIYDALNRSNIPHITVLHLHTKDTNLPQKMLKALPTPPKPFKLMLKNFSFVKASKNSKMPWWFDINVEKSNGYETINEYNQKAVAALSPLRDSPLPRVSGSIYADSTPQAKSQIEELGVSGLNRIKDGKIEQMYRPHITLSYSMQDINPILEKEMQNLSDEFNAILKEGIPAEFKYISIVELGFSGNVLREIYRIDLDSGNVTDIAKSVGN